MIAEIVLSSYECVSCLHIWPASLSNPVCVCLSECSSAASVHSETPASTKCLQCGRPSARRTNWTRNTSSWWEGNCPLTCDLCNKGFISSASLESHMKLHSDQKTYSCIFCPESFDRLDLLKDHVAILINDGYFSYPTCKKQFPRFYPEFEGLLLIRS